MCVCHQTPAQPTYKLGAMHEFTRKLYGMDMPPGAEVVAEAEDAATEEANPESFAGYGTGEMHLAHGDHYEGQWKDGKMEGRGVYTFADGRKYDCQWVAGKMHGAGHVSFGRGNEYEGQFSDGKPHGHGVRLFADGDRYEGNFVRGIKEGHGVYHYANGDEYEGSFVNGMRQGHGVFRYADGQSHEGEWLRDIFYKASSSGRAGFGIGPLRNENLNSLKALMQKNDDSRACIHNMRGAEPLEMRRPRTQALSHNELRAENAQLLAYISVIDHEKFVRKINIERVSAQRAIEKVEEFDAASPRVSARDSARVPVPPQAPQPSIASPRHRR